MTDSGYLIAVTTSCHNKQVATLFIALLRAYLRLKRRPSYLTPACPRGFSTGAQRKLSWVIFCFVVEDPHCYPQQHTRSGSHHYFTASRVQSPQLVSKQGRRIPASLETAHLSPRYSDKDQGWCCRCLGGWRCRVTGPRPYFACGVREIPQHSPRQAERLGKGMQQRDTLCSSASGVQRILHSFINAFAFPCTQISQISLITKNNKDAATPDENKGDVSTKVVTNNICKGIWSV